MINAGNHTSPIMFMEVNQVKDSGGGFEPGEPTLYWKTKADVEQLNSVKTLQANQQKLISGFTFKVRPRKDKEIVEDMYVLYKNKMYNITNVEYKKRDRSVLIVTALLSDMTPLVEPFYIIYFGPLDRIPVIESDIESLQKATNNNSPIILNTGINNQFFIVKTFDTVIANIEDEDSEENLTTSYVPVGEININNVLHEILMLKNVIDYSENHKHIITI